MMFIVFIFVSHDILGMESNNRSVSSSIISLILHLHLSFHQRWSQQHSVLLFPPLDSYSTEWRTLSSASSNVWTTSLWSSTRMPDIGRGCRDHNHHRFCHLHASLGEETRTQTIWHLPWRTTWRIHSGEHCILQLVLNCFQKCTISRDQNQDSLHYWRH